MSGASVAQSKPERSPFRKPAAAAARYGEGGVHSHCPARPQILRRSAAQGHPPCQAESPPTHPAIGGSAPRDRDGTLVSVFVKPGAPAGGGAGGGA